METINNQQYICYVESVNCEDRIGVDGSRSESVETWKAEQRIVIPCEVEHIDSAVDQDMVTFILGEVFRDNLFELVLLVKQRLGFVEGHRL